jgi:hypothetical protein
MRMMEITPLAPMFTALSGKRECPELRVVISNHTRHDYDDVDILLTPNVPSREAVQTTNVPGVSLDIMRKAGDAEVVDTDMYASGKGSE